MLNDGSNWLARLQINEVSGILNLPNNWSLILRLTTKSSLSKILGLIFELNQSLEFWCTTNTWLEKMIVKMKSLEKLFQFYLHDALGEGLRSPKAQLRS